MAKSKSKNIRVLTAQQIKLCLERLRREILREHKNVDQLAFIGIRTRGYYIAKRLCEMFNKTEGKQVPLGEMDITLYRDDLNTLLPTGTVDHTKIPFDITNKTIILFDDVLNTGRTVRAAVDHLIDLGRPRVIHLAVLIDRGYFDRRIPNDLTGKHRLSVDAWHPTKYAGRLNCPSDRWDALHWPTPFIRSPWIAGRGVTIAAIHSHARSLQERFLAALEGGGAPLSADALLTPRSLDRQGNFLTFDWGNWQLAIEIFAIAVNGYGVLPDWAVTPVAYGVIALETVLAILLISGVGLRWSSAAASGLLLFFFCIMLRAYFLGMSIDCGCFGPGDALSAKTLARDGALLALALGLTVAAFKLSPQRTQRAQSKA